MSRLEPLDDNQPGAAGHALELARERLGFVPNSMRILARKPDILSTYSDFAHAVWAPGRLSGELKALIAHISSRTAGCLYCAAHTTGMAVDRDAPSEKIKQIWDYETNPLFSEAERAALRVTQLASQVPNAVADEDFAALKEHFDEVEIVEIVSVIAIFGFLNRWNDTMATTLEDKPFEMGERHLKEWGWTAGKHRP